MYWAKVTVYLTVDVEDTGCERITVGVERQGRVGGLEKDVDVVDADSSLLKFSTQRLPAPRAIFSSSVTTSGIAIHSHFHCNLLHHHHLYLFRTRNK